MHDGVLLFGAVILFSLAFIVIAYSVGYANGWDDAEEDLEQG